MHMPLCKLDVVGIYMHTCTHPKQVEQKVVREEPGGQLGRQVPASEASMHTGCCMVSQTLGNHRIDDGQALYGGMGADTLKLVTSAS